MGTWTLLEFEGLGNDLDLEFVWGVDGLQGPTPTVLLI